MSLKIVEADDQPRLDARDLCLQFGGVQALLNISLHVESGRALHALATDRGSDALLAVDDLHLAFGGVRALRGVSLEVRRGEIFSLIGPNGAGKTVLLNCVNGL